MSDLISRLQWRYATKKMNPAKDVPQEKVERILEAARLAPTSSGLQPFEIIVVTNPAVRAQLQAKANDQAQITEGSHLLVFAAWDNYRKMLLNLYPARDPQVNFEHAARQAYIGLGAALIAAAYEHVDSTPMEGFDPKSFDEILNLSARGLRSVAIMPLGYREEGKDWLEKLPKIRRPREEFIIEVK